MNKIKTILNPAILLLLFLVSCGKHKTGALAEEEFIEVKVKNDYSISLPGFLEETQLLNSQASLQYQNIFKETYIIIIDESKDEFIRSFKETGIYNDSISTLSNYAEYQNNYFNKALKARSFSSGLSDTVINNLPAVKNTTIGKVEGVDEELVYWNAYIESRDKMYNIACWTYARNRSTYEETFKKALHSFKKI
ncbi:hypothetical protein [Abyssalbus ytuae]|uniref:Lipoprotein n=1 Tax=Abyssalbus ytuae TaxID=2926907 RepID=A0A9E6ZL34_9FLAO|nr:hypothetical protein [Abyssalbus ytuae]UOB16220.1 hypothetical protein MQE35_10780 [Abyssalbus ytuae]